MYFVVTVKDNTFGRPLSFQVYFKQKYIHHLDNMFLFLPGISFELICKMSLSHFYHY